MVEVYAQARARFSVDEHRHYLFTPRDLTAWVVALLRYPLATERSVVDVLAYEAARIFRDRLVGSEACQRFDALLAGTRGGYAPPNQGNASQLCLTPDEELSQFGVYPA